MRDGIEKKIYDKFNQLIREHENPSCAVTHLEYIIFVEYAHEFEKL